MARIRTIKPEFFTSEDIVGLSPFARLLYVALWCEADKEGRMVWKPATFKLRYLPGDSCDVQALCQELIDAKLVILYGEGYAYIPAFKAHQHINPRESASQLPDPSTRQARVGTRQSRASDAQGGREGKGREGNDLSPNGDSPPDGEPYEAPDCPHQDIVELYHECLPNLPRVEVWNDTRKGMLRQRWREVCTEQKYTGEQAVGWFRDFFGLVSKSAFLNGRAPPKPGGRPFLADLEWLVRPLNFVKVIEGKYQ